MRHIGQIPNTGSRVIVVFLQIPDAPHKCLIIQSDTLPDYWRETLNRLVQSDEAQTETDFYKVLSRIKAEGQNKDLLTVLHEGGQLVAMPVDNIVMTPMPNHHIPLRKVLEAIGRNVPKSGASQQNENLAQPKRFNQFEENQQADLEKNRAMIARSKLSQAKMLEEDAQRYRLEAYELMPELRPHTSVPGPTAEESSDFAPQVDALASVAASYASEGEQQLSLFDNLDEKPDA